MFISENVEYEPLFGCESISVCENPTFQVRSEHLDMMRLECHKNLLHKAITFKARANYSNLT
jgi:hypothetical protein